MKLDFNAKWQFKKAGDEEYRNVTLPFDAMLHESRGKGKASGSACAWFDSGEYLFVKEFHGEAEWADKNLVLQFEGVYRNATVLLNGEEVAYHAYGFTQFLVDITGKVKLDENNTIEVRVDNHEVPNSRYYTGAGIYRPVTLLVTEKTHIPYGGIKIETASIDPAIVSVETTHAGGSVNIEIIDGDHVVANAMGDCVMLTIPNAVLWSDETPHLYTAIVTLSEGERTVQTETIKFGIRKLEWSNQGFFVNGKNTLLRGGCVHHDNGILGAVSYRKSEYRRAKLLKQYGFNAVRMGHNPASESFLDACDELGIYVLDEFWDMWETKKVKYDYSMNFQKGFKNDILATVVKDYNHPSVIMYSIGNEVADPATDRGLEVAKEIIEVVREADATRPITCGTNLMIITKAKKGDAVYKEDGGLGETEKKPMNSTMFNMVASMVGTGLNRAANGSFADKVTTPFLDLLDIAGYNYASGRYPLEAKAHPKRVIYGSETFPQDIYKNWEMVKKFPYLVGDFMWTALDYLGEAGLGAWAYTEDAGTFDKPYPWLLADSGVLDILGDPNGEAFFAQAVWEVVDTPKIAVSPVKWTQTPIKAVWRGTNALPSWSWSGCEGNNAVVEVYSPAAKVKLYLNGKCVGTQKVKKKVAKFEVKYASGELKAVAFDGKGKEAGTETLRSATGKPRVRITFEDKSLQANEIGYVHVDIVGENNVVESNADRLLEVRVENGELLGFGSANPRTEESFLSGSYTTYYGKALAVVKSGEAGMLKVIVKEPDGKETVGQIEVKS